MHVDTGGAAEHHLQAGTEAEQQAAEKGTVGSELSEDHGGNGNEALAHDGNGTELVGHGHGHAGAAETGKESGYADTDEPHGNDIDTQRLTGKGMLAAGTHTDAETGLIEYEPYHKHQNKYQIGGGVGGKHVV